MLKVCIKTIASAKNARITKKQGQQRKNERRFVKISHYLKYYKVFIQGAEAATQRCSIKNIFKNCTKFTGKSICPNLSFNKVAEMSTATLLKRDSVTVFFLWILCNFYEHLLCITSVKGCFGIWVTYWFINYLRSRVTALWSISICMWRVRKDHLGTQMCIE